MSSFGCGDLGRVLGGVKPIAMSFGLGLTAVAVNFVMVHGWIVLLSVLFRVGVVYRVCTGFYYFTSSLWYGKWTFITR